jgi:hypothetical protein
MVGNNSPFCKQDNSPSVVWYGKIGTGTVMGNAIESITIAFEDGRLPLAGIWRRSEIF